MRRFSRPLASSLLFAAWLAVAIALPAAAQTQRKAQTRVHGQKVEVPVANLAVDDGDTFTITWAPGDTEIVRILGIDTPETKHPQHSLPEDQPWGPEARAFAQGAVAFAEQIQLLRSDTTDPYGRTLGYFFLDGKNYSVAVVAAHLAYESISHYGDNGFPEEAKAVAAAAKVAGTPPFEAPWDFRKKAREAAKGAGSK
jgi:micrococcal nuclease